MDTQSAIKAGFYSWKYIPNHPVPSMRKGKTGAPISSSAYLRAVLHYDKHRAQPLVNDEQLMPDQLLPTKASGVTLTPEDKLAYDQFRPDADEMGGQYFPNRPIKNYGLGASELEIIDNCKEWSNPHMLAFHLITSIHPQFVVILQKHGIDAEKFTETYTVAFVHNFLESVGCDAKIEMAMVIHLIETASGLPISMPMSRSLARVMMTSPIRASPFQKSHRRCCLRARRLPIEPLKEKWIGY